MSPCFFYRYETKQRHYQYRKTRDLLADFNKLYNYKVSIGLFQSLKPFYIVKGKQNSCLCRYCENARHHMYALQNNAKLFYLHHSKSKKDSAATAIAMWFKDKNTKWTRPRGQVGAAELLGVAKKSDVLRRLLCYFDIDDMTNMFHVTCRCLGGGKDRKLDGCPACAGLKRLYRDVDAEKEL